MHGMKHNKRSLNDKIMIKIGWNNCNNIDINVNINMVYEIRHR